MSIIAAQYAQVPEWLLFADVPDGAVRLYAVLRRYSAMAEGAHPKRVTLAERMHSSCETVDRRLADLVRVGAVRIEPRYADDGAQMANAYLLAGDQPHVFPSSPLTTRSRDADDGPVVTTDEAIERVSSREKESSSTGVDVAMIHCEEAHPFDAFWSAYPRRGGKRVGKQPAETQWKRMPERAKAAAMSAVSNYADACETGRVLAKDAVRWLRGQCWVDWASDDEDAPPTAPNALGGDSGVRGGIEGHLTPWAAAGLTREEFVARQCEAG